MRSAQPFFLFHFFLSFGPGKKVSLIAFHLKAEMENDVQLHVLYRSFSVFGRFCIQCVVSLTCISQFIPAASHVDTRVSVCECRCICV